MHTALDVSLPAVPASVREARQTVADIAAASHGTERLVEDVRLCVSEAVANVVRHAYGSDKGDVTLSVEVGSRELMVIIRDEGRGMNGFQREGDLGHGLRIIDQLTRRCSIASLPGLGTELRMVFAIDEAEPER